MRKLFTLLVAVLFYLYTANAQQAETAKLVVHADKPGSKISKHIYGQFSEHLGSCIYGGIWVGKDSKIPNTDGYRNDVLQALKSLQIPNLRWPGGCFADEYHWMDGIGPQANRKKMVNSNWGGVVEDNSFGTHEFLNFCELIGTEPYLSMNVGSGTVEEMAKWVEYVNSAEPESPMANLRRQNGREDPWNVKFIGVGNESWGCGGEMRPEFYADMYRRYQTYCRDYSGNRLYKIASGSSDNDTTWTRILMSNAGRFMQGLSLHYYTVKGWQGSKGSATQFNDDEYAATMNRCLNIEPAIVNHMKVMDRYDPRKRVGLMVDEWGTWFDVEPGTNPGFLFQQNSMRDAFVAGLSLNIFHKYTERVQMANIAQVVNVLQAMILTKDDKMVLTPSYHVFDMYKVHQEATFIPSDLTVGEFKQGDISIPALNVSVSKSEKGELNISIVNTHLTKNIPLETVLEGFAAKEVAGKILTAPDVKAHNTFEKPDLVKPTVFNGAKIKANTISATIPAKSVVVLTLK